ncbi:cysteine synthase A [Naumannella cuiyingiana]|uniref:L-cysteine desulfhydrase Cds1 n=1 Tax=Naumannella cuiyingiana TaxID=1347891 RepID=A0A7Z0D6L8_9ACTN|nr:cysteine synthase A [Naumannella cuiyingiana]
MSEPSEPSRVCHSDPDDRRWSDAAMGLLRADAQRSADTHLIKVDLGDPDHQLYLKDESTHPSGSLKHRLARSLFLHALANGWLRPGAPVIEASSGSTAVSEAYFARMLGVPFIAVMPRSTSPAKVALIEREGGRCHFVDDPAALGAESQRLATELGGHFMDQFTMAERATDWRGNNNIAESIFAQLAAEPHPVPAWIVVGAGTGGTSATIGRYLRYRRLPTRLCVVDPEGSAFFAGYRDADPTARETGSRIEGIGRPRVELSFVSQVIDQMIRVPDAASVAATRWISERLGRRVGGSTGTNIVGVAMIMAQLRAAGSTGSVVSLICDPGDRYAETYFDDTWVRSHGLDPAPWSDWLDRRLGG